MYTSSNEQSSDYAIRVADVSYCYRGSASPSLEQINLKVQRGQCFGLLGPNGAGKTTLLSILTGMLPAQAGQVEIAGLPLSQSDDIKRLSAIVPQDFAFYPGLTGRENLDFFAGLHGLSGIKRTQAVAKAVAVCQLEDVVDKRVESYSGGLKRRLNLGIGLLNDPQILYLDEPTVGIDAQSRNFILDAIQTLKAAGVTIVYTSHYMEEVQAICDEIAIIDRGRVVLQSSLAALLEEQGQILDVRFFESPRAGQIESLATMGEYEVRGKHLRLRLRSPETSLRELAELLENLQLKVTHMSYGMNRLEDIYLSITKYELRD